MFLNRRQFYINLMTTEAENSINKENKFKNRSINNRISKCIHQHSVPTVYI